jgi:hypothetical protein
MKFCLHVIAELVNISGDFKSMENGKIMNFEDIFENDKEIIANKLKSRDESLFA